MNIPNIPTDSLYKFIAIAGVIMVIAPMYLLVSQYSKFKTASYEQEKNIAILKLKIDQDSLNADYLIESCNTNISKHDKTKKFTREMKDEDKDLLTKIRSNEESSLLHAKDIAILLIDNKRFEDLTKDSLMMIKMFVPLFLIGFFLIFFGFLLWFRNIQAPMDKLLQNQLYESEQSRKKTYKPFGRKNDRKKAL